MKYFIDTEFIEGFHKPLFGKRRHHIDLISIGIVCEDGRTYSAISSEYNYDDASDWVKENVIHPLYASTVSSGSKNFTHASTFNKHWGKTNDKIAKEVFMFVNPQAVFFVYNHWNILPQIYESRNMEHKIKDVQAAPAINPDDPDGGIQFYGYYADYDWVVFCSLFGTMMDLPGCFPMYCRDLKQMLDAKARAVQLASQFKEKQNTLCSYIDFLKHCSDYPQQSNEHNALADAKWNLELYKFLMR